MADFNNNPSNFVSWGQQMALTGDEEERLYNNALKAAQDEQTAAGASLNSAANEASAANRNEIGAQGAGNATTTLQQTGSYTDYLKHQQQAQAKAQAALSSGGNSVSNLMRQQLAPTAWGSNAKFDQGTQALLQRQAQLEQQRGAQAVQYGTDQQAAVARDAAAQRAREEQDAATKAAEQQHVKQVLNNRTPKAQALQQAARSNPNEANKQALLNFAATQAYNAKVAGKSEAEIYGVYMGALGGALPEYSLGLLGDYAPGQGANPAVKKWLLDQINKIAANSGGAFVVANGSR